jgi:DNA primase
MAGFGARIVEPEDLPKFLNSPETPIFSKGKLLYGLDRARKPIRAADQAVIVEGYLDVIAVHQAGYENVVSPMGTALTEDQLRLLKRLTRKIVLALDPDTAGKIAVLRGLETARQSISEKVPLFDEAGEKGIGAPELLRFADQLKVDLRVVTLPDNLDPDELVQRDKDEWEKLIKRAEPIVLHTIKSVIAQHDLDNPKEKVRVVEQLVPFISGVSDPVERDDYRQRLARMLRVDERALIGTQAQGPRVRRTRRRPEGEREQVEVQVIKTVSPSYKTESYCIGILFRRPELLHRLDRQLQEAGLQRLMDEDFGYTDHQILLDIIRQSLEQDQVDHHQFIVSHLPEALKELAGDLLQQTETLGPLEEKILDELMRVVSYMRRKLADESIQQIRYLQEEAQEAGDLIRVREYSAQMNQLNLLRNTLDQARQHSSRRINKV